MRKGQIYFTVLVLSLFTPGLSEAQDKKNSGCYYTREKAAADIKQNTAKILIQGGIAPIIYTTDKEFFDKYKVAYYVFGCVAPENVECLNQYNRAIFEHLDRTFGNTWRKDVRKDAIGLRQ
ncbi:MAG TPA: hypothetical protein VFN95_02970 [Flavitalea sp.]|nr:hypothetical protein [Flavitalea sp.]